MKIERTGTKTYEMEKKYMRHKKAIHLSQLEIFCIAICVSEAEEKFMLTYSL